MSQLTNQERWYQALDPKDQDPFNKYRKFEFSPMEYLIFRSSIQDFRPLLKHIFVLSINKNMPRKKVVRIEMYQNQNNSTNTKYGIVYKAPFVHRHEMFYRFKNPVHAMHCYFDYLNYITNIALYTSSNSRYKLVDLKTFTYHCNNTDNNQSNKRRIIGF